MRCPARSLGAGLIAWPALSSDACAHALAQRYDLPLPLDYFLAGAGAAVGVSFVILAIFSRRESNGPAQSDYTILRGKVPTPIVAGCQILAVGALVLIVAAGLFGHPSTFKNIAPVAVWVIWWVGLSFVSAFVGNVWTLINPWSAAFGFFELLARPWGRGLSLRWSYPAWLDAWPACTLFLLFAWLELIAPARDVPRNVAIAVAMYSGLTWTGFVLFGRETWLKGGEAFSVAFDLFGRFAPLHFTKNGGWHCALRPYAVGLLPREPLAPSMIAFTLLMLATVTVDGIMETPPWGAVIEQLLASRGGVSVYATTYMLLISALLIAGPLVLAGLYLGVVAMMARMVGSSVAALAGLFVLSLVPIAIAYHLSHYFSLLMLAGQFIIPLASDPFGYGWDLFGTTLYRVDIGIVDAKLIWYLDVTAIVTGHIIAVWVGHVTAFAVFSEAGAARRSQYPMLVLMVGYTMVSLWIIAQPIVELGAK
jgi:hypothetical protein